MQFSMKDLNLNPGLCFMTNLLNAIMLGQVSNTSGPYFSHLHCGNDNLSLPNIYGT